MSDTEDTLSSSVREPTEYDGTGTRHAPYGDRAYRDDGGRGQEVSDALELDLAEGLGADDPAQEYLSDRMLVQDQRGDGVPRIIDGDDGDGEYDDRYATLSDDGLDDRHELSAEESAMHYVDEDDRIPD